MPRGRRQPRHQRPSPHRGGTDGSSPTQAALNYAFEQASLRAATLRVVHAWSRPGPQSLIWEPQGAATGEHRKALAEWLASLAEQHPGLALGSVSHHLLQFSQCPLAIVRPDANLPDPAAAPCRTTPPSVRSKQARHQC
ncbi:universal stress protein [Streptomyces noursei]|uniref:universal stress protein n=1 Tax=Streptomyces noursei TaxID=1971 RepID=UPI003799552E